MSHTLVVTIRGRSHLCLYAVPQPPLGRPERVSDNLELRAPGHGSYAYGRILARSARVVSINHGCALGVTFHIALNLGRFSVFDASTGGIWFGFNSADLPRTAWRLTVIAAGA